MQVNIYLAHFHFILTTTQLFILSEICHQECPRPRVSERPGTDGQMQAGKFEFYENINIINDRTKIISEATK
jgi:hypothetical protein